MFEQVRKHVLSRAYFNVQKYEKNSKETKLKVRFFEDSTIAIHGIVIVLIIATRHIVEPILIVEIPTHRLFDTFLELEAGLPAKFSLEFRAVDSIPHVVPRTVGDVSDQVHVGTLGTAQQPIDSVDEHLDEVDILPLVETTDVVSLPYLSLMENQVDGTGMILHIEPVTNVLTFAIYWQGLTLTYIVDKQWNKLLRKLIRTVVVTAVRDDGRKTVGVVEGTHKMVARGLGGAIRRMRLVFQFFREEFLTVSKVMFSTARLGGERRFDTFGMGQLKGAVDLVCADVIEELRAES